MNGRKGDFAIQAYRKIRTLNSSVISSTFMAVGGMGDALLYAYLPLKGVELGMSLFIIGFLLSINKYIRILTNWWVACLANLWGIKRLLLFGSLLSAMTTLVYAFHLSIAVWIIARLIWGLAYSALRFAALQYAGNSEKAGSAMGISKSIQNMGPLLAYWIGPMMISFWGAGFTFISWSLTILALLPLFQYLPDSKITTQEINVSGLKKPSAIDFWVFLSSFVTEGLLIVGLSKLIRLDVNATVNLLAISAFYISLRRLMVIIISPLSGWLSENLSFNKLFQISCLLIIMGLIIIAAGFPGFGVIITFLGSSVNITLTLIIAINFSLPHESYEALTKMTTARDFGSATGSLAALTLLSFFNTKLLFIILSAILILIWFKIRNLKYIYEKQF